MYVQESEPNWADCDFCGRRGRGLYDLMQPIGMEESCGPPAPRACKLCLKEMGEEARAELDAEPQVERCKGSRGFIGCHMPVFTCPSCGAKGCRMPECSLQGADEGVCKKCGKPGMAPPLRRSAS